MSLDSVKTAVLEDVGARAAELLREAGREATRLLADGDAENRRTGEEAIRDARLRAERETLRELERIHHDNRLRILAAKNQAIDETFKRVASRLGGLSDAECLKLVGTWLAALPEDVGGVLRVNPGDVDKFRAGLDALNGSRAGSGRFTAVEADPRVARGAVVEGPDYNIDCTVDRRLNELRESLAGGLARVLFGA